MDDSSNAWLVVRADGSTRTGLGHLYRAAALANMVSRNYRTILAYHEAPASVKDLFGKVFDHFIHLASSDLITQPGELICRAQEVTGRAAVIYLLDGYAFDTDYQQAIKLRGYPLVCIDDIHAYPFVCDLLINHASSADKREYQLAERTKLLFGLRYALVGEPFRRLARVRSGTIGNLNNVFVSLGGADPLNLTLKVVTDCLRSEHLQIHAVLGPAHPSRNSLDTLRLSSEGRLKIHNNLSAEQMATLMQKCALAVTSPSGVALEFLSTGGHLFMLPFAENQQEFYEDATAKGLALPYDAFPLGRVDQTLIQTIFDGQQAERFQTYFNNLITQNKESNG